MSNLRNIISLLSPAVLLVACASQPLGPTVPVMPAPGKPFSAFQEDQAICRQFADGQVAGGAQQANNQQVMTGVLGTAIGAGAGALLGGGRGAAVGAGLGAVGGTAIGAGQAQRAQGSMQYRYDIAYSQCMYSRGNQVPGYAPPGAPPPPPPPGYGQPAYR
jgi:hypothetical protein